MLVSLTDPLKLPCGAILSNRVAKPAITEGMADPLGAPTPELYRLYKGWADGGQGLMISGNIIVDNDHLERPGNVIVDENPSDEKRAKLQEWTAAARSRGGHFWAQLSHSGRQTPIKVNKTPMSPSAIKVDLPGNLFGKPKEMTHEQILEVIDQFVNAARICKEVGFTGVQIHAAHGYLLSSFLSAKSNTRTDEWGGSLENRSCLLIAIVLAVRHVVGKSYPISVKLNSADFQKGTFGLEASVHVALTLQKIGVDLLEITGGSYENPVMMGDHSGAGTEAPPKKTSTLVREAYFLDFARALRDRLTVPIMLTGGLRTRIGMQEALNEGIDVLGIARPLCVDLACVKPLLDGTVDVLPSWEERLRREKGFFSSNSPIKMIRTLTSFSGIFWFYAQLNRLAQGDPADVKLWPPKAMLEVLRRGDHMLGERKKALKKAA